MTNTRITDPEIIENRCVKLVIIIINNMEDRYMTLYLHCATFSSKYSNVIIKVQPNQIWQDQDDAHSLIILARSMVLPYLIGSYFSYFDMNVYDM